MFGARDHHWRPAPRHLLCHVVLTYSNCEWVACCGYESLLTLRHGLQESLQRLGNELLELQIDNPSAAPVTLHSIWDRALGATVNVRAQYNYAIAICAVYSRTNLVELSKHKIPESWRIESRAIAIEDTYLRGNLKGSKEAADAPPLPDGYTKQMKMIAERQAALAGYRLADEIEKYIH